MRLIWLFMLFGLICSPIYGRLHLRKLSANDVYNALREAGRLDAIPEGRVVTQGIAAAAGFTAGLVKGIGIPILLGLTFPNTNTNSSSNGQATIQEICFSSRSAENINIDGKAQPRQNTQISSGSGSATASADAVASPTTSTTNTETDEMASPTTTTGTGTGGQTSIDDGEGTGTHSVVTTETGGGRPVNCIVIQKPVKP